jgi:hypothetical protein
MARDDVSPRSNIGCGIDRIGTTTDIETIAEATRKKTPSTKGKHR